MPDCYYLGPDDETIGPHSTAEVARLFHAGKIESDSMVWIEGTVDWVPIQDWAMRVSPRGTARVPLALAPAVAPEPTPVELPRAVEAESAVPPDLSGLRLVAPPKAVEAPSLAPAASGLPSATVAPVPPPAARKLEPDDVLPANASIPRSSLPTPYRLALVVCAILSLLVPMIHLSVAGSVGWWGVQRIRSYAPLSKSSVGNVRVVRFSVLYALWVIGPGLAACAVSVFMGSVLFSRRSEREEPIVLGQAAQPRLFEVIRRICAAVGAPMPERVELDCEPNASASLAEGLRGLQSGQLRLRIGLPLVSALSVREFCGVLAHEFGHFAQRHGMRLSVVVRRLNVRLAEMAWSRTEWDDRLSGALGSGVGLVMAAAALIKIGLGLARLLLKGLVMVNHIAVCTLLRQMEFDADRAEAHLAGSAAFASAAKRITVINQIFGRYHLRAGFDQSRPYDLPSYLMDEYGRLRPGEEDELYAAAEADYSKLFATHPTNAARVAAAQAINSPGLVLSDAPAQELFEHYDDLARTVTVAHFQAYEVGWALERRALAS
ncbi:MAG: M48 family metalloprotease [Verrucomicrobia bacterium]|nr:M48 family metalloprotease [Verrucomicrobiota bacterium]